MNQHRIRVRPGTDADRPRILERITDVFGTESAERIDRLWDWQWHQDPRLRAPGYRGIVAEWRGQIIANLTTIPAGLYLDGRSVSSDWLVDVLVHWGMARRAMRELRRAGAEREEGLKQGLAAAMFDHPDAGQILLAKHISAPMTAVLRQNGFQALPDTGSMQRRISLRRTFGRVIGEHLGAVLGSIANVALPRIRLPKLAVTVMEGPFGPQFNELWDRARSRYAAVTCRDSATLNWRYRQHPFARYDVVTVNDGETLRGYLVFIAYRRRDRLLAKIVDLLALPGDDEALRALLGGALRLLRARHVERVDAFSSGVGTGTVLREVGFRDRLAKSGRPGPLMARGLPTEQLYVTQGDGDGG